MTILIFIRHGETAWSRSKEFRFRGRIDIPLTNHGILQAKATGRRLQDEKITKVYTSPLKRAKDTASEIARMHNLEVLDHPGFIDLNFGTWQGELHKKLKKEQGELYNQWLSSPETVVFPKGEALVNVRERIESACNDLVTKYLNETIVIVTHGAVLRVILCFLKGIGNEHYWEYKIDNCALLIAKFENGNYSILTENDNEHLLV